MSAVADRSWRRVLGISRLLGRSIAGGTSPAAHSGVDVNSPIVQMSFGFDAQYYIKNYLDGDPKVSSTNAYAHYLATVRTSRASPNPNFSEEWYLSRYSDVREVVEAGKLPCGFYHYLIAGQREGRMPRFELDKALEFSLPGVTAPSLRNNIEDLRARTRRLDLQTGAPGSKMLWILMPHFNPDILFGGYRAFFEFLRAVKASFANEFHLKVITTGERTANKDYFQWRARGKADYALFEDVDVKSLDDHASIRVGPHDRVVAYSTWDAYFATQIAALTDEPRFIGFHQEYEPIFHSFGSHYALSAAAYDLPSYPIFNSSILVDYFKQHRIGLFGRDEVPVEGKDYAVFEHLITPCPLARPEEMAKRKVRTCAVYARPEGHAARNLYELIEIALRDLCAAGHFDSKWRFVGLGSLKQHPPVALGRGHQLEFIPKMSEIDYFNFVSSIDLGISLMYAPHPSVVPFEFATTGALVVTNTFENRSPEFLKSISANFETTPTNIDGLKHAIERAVERVPAFDQRYQNAYRPIASSWGNVFNPTSIEQMLRPVGMVPSHAD